MENNYKQQQQIIIGYLMTTQNKAFKEEQIKIFTEMKEEMRLRNIAMEAKIARLKQLSTRKAERNKLEIKTMLKAMQHREN